MQKMNGQIKKNSNGWLVVNSLSGLSTRIKIDFIRKIEIEHDVIEIQVENHWVKVGRYNQDVIEAHLRETEKFFKENHQGDDNYYKKGAKERHIQEDQENEKHYLESLDKNITERNWKEKECGGTLSKDISWLKDKDFDCLKQQLESLSDNFALNVKEGR